MMKVTASKAVILLDHLQLALRVSMPGTRRRRFAPYDFEGDDRITDGDEDGEAIVDMDVDEYAVVGTCFRVHLPVVFRGYC